MSFGSEPGASRDWTEPVPVPAKADPVTIDREALIERMARASAESRYDYVNFGKRWGDLGKTEQDEWLQQERRRMTTLVDDVVIAHLAAQPVTGEDQIISEGERWSVFDIIDGAIVASFDSWGVSVPEDRAREVFATYPRRTSLLRERVVKYEREIVEINSPEVDESGPTDGS